MQLSSAAQWWDEWQLRILVLGSLALQWFLLLAAPMRKYSIPLWLRRCIQLGSGCSDAVAIYALATVFNRHANGTIAGCYNGEAADVCKPPSMLEVLWAPVLLIHLGGVEEVSASSIDDNTLWIRQTVSLLSQVTIAIFGFYKSWPGTGTGDRRMLASAVLLFILGILSVLEKPLALRGARVDPLMAELKVLKGGARVKPSSWWKRCFTELDDRYKCWKELPEGDAAILSKGDQVQMILSDLLLFAAIVTLQAQRKHAALGGGREFLEPLDINKDDKLIKRILRQAFGLIYTRANVMLTPAYLACHVLLVPSLHIAAIMLFVMSQQKKQSQPQGYNSGGTADIKTTYILLCLTAVLDVFGVLISKLCDSLMFKGNVPALCQKLRGYSLIDSVLSQTRTTTTTIGWLLRCVRCICYKEGYSGKEKDLWLGSPVSEAITTQLVKVFERFINADLSSYRSFTKKDYWTKSQTKRLLKMTCSYDQLIDNAVQPTDDQPNKIGNVMIWRSLRRMPFDASVLIWHIATDLCFRIEPPMHFSCRPPHLEVVREVCTQAISDYMAYLLMFRPDMLMTGSRQHLFTEAAGYMERIIKEAIKEDESQSEQPRFDRIFLDKIKKKADSLRQEEAYSVIYDACKLAEELLDMEDDDDRWYLMHRMWRSMLCYSASMCRGYLHAKSLGEGGEFLSYVWLLISLQGAKTLADKLQMPDKEQGDDDLEYLLYKKPIQDLDTTTMPEPEWRRAHQPLKEDIFWGIDLPF